MPLRPGRVGGDGKGVVGVDFGFFLLKQRAQLLGAGQRDLVAGFQLGDAVLVTERARRDRSSVELTCDPRALGEVTAGLRFELSDAASGAPISSGTCLLATSTTIDVVSVGPDGRGEDAGCSPGPARLKLRLDGYEAREVELDLAPGAVLDLGRIELERGVVLSGTARGTTDTSRISLTVRPHDPGTPYRALPAAYGYGVERDGSFRIDLGPGLYVLSAMDRVSAPPSLSPNYLVDLRGGPVEGLSVELQPSVPVVVVPEDRSWDGASGTLVDASGLACARFVLSGDRPERCGVPRGDYLLRLEADGSVQHEQAFRASDEQVELAVPPRPRAAERD